MLNIKTWELVSYIVTVFGLPLGIFAFIWQQRKERENEDEAVYQMLSDAYTDFLKLVMQNHDLKLRSKTIINDLTEEQRERTNVIFKILISLFERAYLLAFDDNMSAKQTRRWASWDDYMRDWCERDDFKYTLPQLLQGEDASFAAYIQKIANEEVTPKTY